MYLRTILIIAVLGTLVFFAALNWAAFTTPTTLSLGFTSMEAPLGLILLGFLGLLTFLFLIYLIYLQSSALVESRRYARELQVQKEIAEDAEASRFSRLKSFLENELSQLAEQHTEFKTAVFARLDELDREVRATVEQSSNTLAAYIGEIEDRLEHKVGK